MVFTNIFYLNNQFKLNRNMILITEDGGCFWYNIISTIFNFEI